MSKKPKLFECTECKRKCDHVTTRWDKEGDVTFIMPGERLCTRCVNKRLDGSELSAMEKFKQLSREDQMEILKQLELQA